MSAASAITENADDLLFRPGRIGTLDVRNRIVMAPMTRSLSPGGVPSPDVAAYYRRRAEGGVGLIVTEGTWIPDPSASDDPAVPRFHGEDALAGWRHVAAEVHAGGGLIMPQLWHVGQVLDKKTGASRGHCFGPSGLTGGMGVMGVMLKPTDGPATQAEIDAVVDAYATAALSAKDLGFDGVELHGGHGYLLDQFFWAETNRRTDRYGGGVAERTRLAADIVREIKRRAGRAFPVILRFSQFKLQDYAARPFATPDDLEDFLRPLVDAGVDAFHASQRRFWEGEFGTGLNLAGWSRKLSGKPAITVGSVTLQRDLFEGIAAAGSGVADNLLRLREMMARGEFEFVAVGRALIANPDWPRRVRGGQPIQPFDARTLAHLD